MKPRPPFIPGHEGVGYVAKLGAGVTRLKEGDRVGVPWLHTACGCCTPCRTGWETLCGSQQNTGYSLDGTFAQYGLADPDFVGRLPEKLEFGPAAPVLCAGVTVYKGLKETEVRPGEWVLVSGIGGLGHMAVQYAKAMPPVPAFYHKPQSVEEIIDHLAARAVDLVGLPVAALAAEWDPHSHRQYTAAMKGGP